MKLDFNKNNLITKIPKPTIIYSDGRLTIYVAGKLIKEEIIYEYCKAG